MGSVRGVDASEITRAVREVCMELDDFPVWVVNDCRGRDLYQETTRPWRRDELLPEDLRAAVDTHEGSGGG